MENPARDPTAVTFTAQLLEWGYDAQTLTRALIKAHEKAQQSWTDTYPKQLYSTHAGDRTQSHAQAVFVRQLLEAILDPVWNNRTLAHAESHAERAARELIFTPEDARIRHDVHPAPATARRRNRRPSGDARDT